ncbi:helix-turn-helix domain-containing protein [Motilimonas sp. E26]|uniref:helix-turn-helix transcriptional regulator n=1 Tax=Motilimonas sp. E26 TaxID=2865674 RepID=UPI001E622B2A|nr:helix-turn-helix domain-containing protein [Motilimonas sp. E26]MCE0555924.1 AraC family transcriptional regulator [Motilimonas sp. E26]
MIAQSKWQNLKRWVQKAEPNERILGLGYVRCVSAQQIRDLQSQHNFLVIIVQGTKWVSSSCSDIAVKAGQGIVFPAHVNFTITNTPKDGAFYALVLFFTPEQISSVQQQYGKILQQSQAKKQTFMPFTVDETVLSAVLHLLDAYQSGLAPALLDHRYTEILLSLLLSGHGNSLFQLPQSKWSDKVSQLFSLDPAFDWSVANVSARLNLSETTLSRRLKEEQTSFRQLLVDARLGHGLHLLQSGIEKRPIAFVSELCGYQSASTFSAKFKQRFGMLPSELQKTVI